MPPRPSATNQDTVVWPYAAKPASSSSAPMCRGGRRIGRGVPPRSLSKSGEAEERGENGDHGHGPESEDG